jgi:hypothetical protein
LTIDLPDGVGCRTIRCFYYRPASNLRAGHFAVIGNTARQDECVLDGRCLNLFGHSVEVRLVCRQQPWHVPSRRQLGHATEVVDAGDGRLDNKQRKTCAGERGDHRAADARRAVAED